MKHTSIIPKLSLSVVLLSLIGLTVFAQMPQEGGHRTDSRSIVITPRGIVASDSVQVSQAAAEILARGGSAADAAVAASAAMSVVEPMFSGMGGDLFAIEYNAKTGKLTGLNASGWAPEKLTPQFLKSKGFKTMPQSGIDSVTVPGEVSGWWAMHQRFGRLPWKEVLQPAIYYARHGTSVTQLVASYWTGAPKLFRNDPYAQSVYLPGGKAPKVGQMFRNPDYAKALELVAADGSKAFYDGPIAKAIVDTSNKLGGTMTLADLAEFQPQWVTPISTTYRGWSVYELPPNGQGMATLEMLNIMERFPLAKLGFMNAEAFNIKMQSQQLAYADLRKFLGDPRFVHVPVSGIISKAYAAQRAKTINLEKANCNVSPGNPSPFQRKGDTTYLTVVDSQGNIVSMIQSLFDGFGSGVVVQGYGFALQNRGGLFLLNPSSPDVLAPHKRPYHTIIPAFMQKGDLHIGFGIMGGLNQPQAQAQFVSDIVDSHMDLQGALQAPRFTNRTFKACHFEIESRIPESIRKKLTAMGYQLSVLGPYSGEVGGGHAVMYDSATGMKYGASSPRKDGAAIPQPPPIFEHSQ